MTTTIILVISLLVLLVGFLIVRGLIPKASVPVEVEGPYPLSFTKDIGTVKNAQDVLVNKQTGTVQVFVYVLPYQRTATATACSSGNKGDPACGTDRYDICDCNGTDCSNCAHKGFEYLLNLSQVIRLEVLNVPDASRPNSAYAQLVVRTIRKAESTAVDTADKRTIETFPLPPIPFQKWTMVTIARDSRRIDVFYNDEVVLSKRTQNMIDFSAAFSTFKSGSPSLSGKIGKIRFFDRRLALPEVKEAYKSLANTRGEPSFSPINFKEVFSNLNLCPSGDCLSGLSVNPPSGLVEWSSSYS